METIRKPGRFIEVTRKALALRKPLVMLKVGTGEISAEGGMTAGVAKLILDKRRAIERIFAEHDELAGSNPSSGKIERLHAV